MALIVKHLDSGVAVATLSDEAARNAFDRNSMQAISGTLNELMDDSKVRSVILTGSGKFFCAGADIREFDKSVKNGTIGDLVGDLTGILHPLQIRMRGDSTVFIAAINGAAAGGGLGLALACDARIAVPESRLSAAFFRLGLSPDGGTTWLLPRLVGTQTTKRFFFNDETWNGETALLKGAVDEVVHLDELIPRSIEMATDWGRWAEMSRRSTKQLLDAQSSTFFETQLEFERALITAASMTEDFATGVSAFLEKKEPEFE